MDSLPPVTLGAIVFASAILFLALRPRLEKSLVEAGDIFFQPRRQFLLDFGLGVAASAAAALFNWLVLKFPFFSGVKLAIGMAALAFFLALDSAISRQRLIIDRACTKGWRSPPGGVSPLARKFAMLAVTSAVFVAALLSVIIANSIDWFSAQAATPDALASARKAVTAEILFVIGVLTAAAGMLIVRYAENLRRLMTEQTAVMEAVSRGELGRYIPVATPDEFGVIAARTNAMIDGLRHRTELIEALDQAKAVQRSLLPSAIPVREGLDMAATAVYSGQTGGDYYDFLELSGESLGIVVADVSGHGVDSALLMASARGFLRQAALCLSDTGRIVTTLNRHLARDVEGSGHFITLFFLVIDPVGRRVEWIRAGHDPAMVFDPATGGFSELRGAGLPLAVDQESAYIPQRLGEWPSGSILVLGTDGLWEAFGQGGEMYGKDRLKRVIAANAHQSARELLESITADWRAFLGEAVQEDDVTLAVVRFDAS
jgi:sigma-B regulation protein RsbU (phosphoserine phosphatase)